jgi:hypothetical protein
MSKKNILIFSIIIIALIAILVTLSSILSRKPEAAEPEAVTEVVEGAKPEAVEMETEKLQERYYSMDLEYPKAGANELKEVSDYVTTVRNDFMDLVPKTDDEAAYLEIDEDHALVLKMDTTTYTSANTVTYKIETYLFTGGAHGGTVIATFTYDHEGKFLPLENILSSPDSLTTLSSRARKYFYNKLGAQGERGVIDIGTEPKPQNWNAWYVTDTAVTFVFQQYQIGPFATGIQEFPLSRAEAKTLLNI